MNENELSASEAIWGFVGFLTSLEEPVTMSASDGATRPAELAGAFIRANGLTEPRKGWEHSQKWPEGLTWQYGDNDLAPLPEPIRS